MNIKRFALIVLLVSLVSSDCMAMSSWRFPSVSWPTFSWRSIDFGNWSMQKIRESNAAFLLLGVAAITGLGAYLWSRYGKRNQQTPVVPLVPLTISTTEKKPAEIKVESESIATVVPATTSVTEILSPMPESSQKPDIQKEGLDSSRVFEEPRDVTISTTLEPQEIKTPYEEESAEEPIKQEETAEDKFYNYLSQDIKVGESPMSGRRYCPVENVCISQIKVFDQNVEKCGVAIGGGKDSCGYQIIKNGMLIVKKILDGFSDLQKDLLSTSIIQNLLGLSMRQPGLPRGIWRDPVIQQREEAGEEINKGEGLNMEEIQLVLNQVVTTQEWPKEVGFMIIEDSGMIAGEEAVRAYYGEDKWEVIKQMREDLKSEDKQILYAFFVSTSRHEGSGGTYGHWFVIVLYKELGTQERNYIIADSKNIVRLYNDDQVKAVVGLMEGSDVANKLLLSDLKERAEIMKALLATIKAIQESTSLKEREILRKRLMELQERYTTWANKLLSEKEAAIISEVLFD